MNLRDFFELGSERPPPRKTDRVAESLSEVSLFRQDTASNAHARDEQRVEDPDLVRSRANGRFADDPLATDEPGVDRRRHSGRYIDAPQADTEIGRNTETGRFVDRGER